MKSPLNSIKKPILAIGNLFDGLGPNEHHLLSVLILTVLFQLSGVWYALYAFLFYTFMTFLLEYHYSLFIAKQNRIERELREMLNQ